MVKSNFCEAKLSGRTPVIDYLLRSSLNQTPSDEIAEKLYYAAKEVLDFREYLLRKKLSRYFSDFKALSDVNFQMQSFPGFFWKAACKRRPLLQAYPLGDWVERSIKRTIAYFLFPPGKSNHNTISKNTNPSPEQMLSMAFDSVSVGRILEQFLTQLFYEISLTNLRSKSETDTDFGYSFNFSKGRLVSLDTQTRLRKTLLRQCRFSAAKFLPHLLDSLKAISHASSVSTLSRAVDTILFSKASARVVKRRRPSKPIINVIVGARTRSQLRSSHNVADHVIRIMLDGKQRNVTFELSDFESFTGHPLHSLTKDLLEISFATYISDLCVSRNPDFSRTLGIFIPVRNPDIWSRTRSKLELAVSFLARDNVRFFFGKKKQDSDDAEIPICIGDPEKCCCLLSGGIDSAVGSVWALKQGYSPVFLSYSPGNLTRIQKDLVEKIGQKTNCDLPHLVISWQPSKRKKSPYRLVQNHQNPLTQHLRSFFYLSLATALAVETECHTVYAYENGPVAVNPLLSEAHINTRTVHPVFLNHFQDFIDSAIGNIDIKNPFLYCTKGELVQYLSGAKMQTDIIPLTSSCFAYSYVKTYAQQWCDIEHYEGRHDGDCLPCIARRVSMHHANVPSKHDDVYLIDVFDLFDSPVFLAKSKHFLDTIIRTADLLRFCEHVRDMPIHELIVAFPDLYFHSAGADCLKLTDMYKRYAEQTIKCFREKSSSKFQEVFETVFK